MKRPERKKSRYSQVTNILFIGIIALLFLVPASRAAMLQGLMHLGLFSPDVEAPEVPAVPPLDGFRFMDARGNVVDLGAQKGKILFINFWATWCPPCRAEMPSLNKLHTKWKDDKEIIFLFVDADGKLPEADAFLKKRDYNWPLYQMASPLPREFFSGALPTTLIVDKFGRLAFRHEGIANYADKKFDSFLQQLKAQKS